MWHADARCSRVCAGPVTTNEKSSRARVVTTEERLATRARGRHRTRAVLAASPPWRTPNGRVWRHATPYRCHPPQSKHAAPLCRSLCCECEPWSYWHDPQRQRPPPARDPRYSSPPRAHPVPVGPGSLLSAQLRRRRRSPRSRYVLLLVGFTG